LELARCAVERLRKIGERVGIAPHPKTRNFNTRTMEIARGWGPVVYKRLRSIDTPPGWKSPIRFTRTATGEQLGVIESNGFEGTGPDVSPAWPVMSSQELIEAILLDAVRDRDGRRPVDGGDAATRRERMMKAPRSPVRSRSTGQPRR
jgi:hypothetical protein